ncbi:MULTISPECIES: RadC family protein [Clostridium]|uniref:RadC family protein n=1 Tax=Clostridium TaxID=1485 RepID=UPI0008249836|nr:MULTISPECIES: DNA repair protein RadC [Clostridium]PJI07133.1 JAB domain-containing protein [Clostridium sp. CT7]
MNNNLKIADLPKSERPRERLLRYGSEVLSNSELLAIILRTGTLNENIINLSSRILSENGGLNGVLNLKLEELKKIKGIGNAKAVQIIAVGELFKRFKTYKSGEKYKITSPRDAVNLVMEELKSFNKEHLYVIMLNTKNIVIKISDVSVGSLNSSIVHPREVYVEPILKHAASIILCHNHPSGDPKPSNEDINITKRLFECSKIIGIELLDHIIVGEGIYVSLKEEGLI